MGKVEELEVKLANVRVRPYVRKGDRGFEQVGGYTQGRDLMNPANVGEGLRRRADTAQRKQTGATGAPPPAPKAPGKAPAAPKAPGAPGKAPGLPTVPAGGPGEPGNAPGPPVLQHGTGKPDDPIVTSDVNVAAQAIADGKHVRLKQRRQVSTLLDKLAEMVKDAAAKGEKAPTYNLCLVSVANTNLFCAENKGRSRVEMPQFAGVPRPGSPADKFPKDAEGQVNLSEQFAEFLASQGHQVTRGKLDASLMRASQNELNGAKVAKIASSIEEHGFQEGGPDVWVSNDDYVIDGHHRWAAVVGVEAGTDQAIEMPVRQVDLDIVTILDLAKRWTEKMGIEVKAVSATSRVVEWVERGKKMEEVRLAFEGRVTVPPYLRVEDGKVQNVSGYTRKGRKSLSDIAKAITPSAQVQTQIAPTALAAVASTIRQRAEQEEPDVTPLFTQIAKDHGGRMTGLKYKWKTEPSLQRKIAGRVEERHQPVSAVAEGIHDALRYTMVFSEATYTDSVKSVLADLQKKGWSYDASNYWAPGDPYDGLNMEMIKPNGYRLELQFHTPQSVKIKEALIHPLYEEFRTSKDNARRRQLYDQMVAICRTIRRPKNIEGLPFTPLFKPYVDLPAIPVV